MSSLSEVFNDNVLARWRKECLKAKQLTNRLAILSASGPYPKTPPWRWHRVAQLRAIRAAWETYLDSGFHIGLFDGTYGSDILNRLRDSDDGNFRGAMAECFAAWFFVGRRRLNLTAHPKTKDGKVPEFIIHHPSGNIFAEVKAKHREIPEGAWTGFDDDALVDALNEAVKQLPKGEKNLLIIVPTLRGIKLFDNHTPFVRAFYGEEKIVFHLRRDSGEAVKEPTAEFVQNGKLLNLVKSAKFPGNTRISGVLCLEEEYQKPTTKSRDSFIEPLALMLHNPFAEKPIPIELLAGIPQFVPKEGRMAWIEPASRWK